MMKPEESHLIPLASVLENLPVKILSGEPGDAMISGVVMDNRRVVPGNLFVAIRGGMADGHAYIQDAIQSGATAVVGEKPLAGLSVPYIQVENSRQALTWLAAAFFGNPGRKLTVIGVTGTDGKTTTCNLLYQILLNAGLKVGLISTVNAVIGDEVLDTGFHVTTPDAPDVQWYLSRMVSAGLTHVVLETTSHGWAQFRVDACEFDVGVVTNVTHEHLDQHGSYENYLAAKARLVQALSLTRPKPQGNPRLLVLNRDDSSYGFLSKMAQGPQLCYGLSSLADVRAEGIEYYPAGMNFIIMSDGINLGIKQLLRTSITTSLVGNFNVSNCLAAFGAAVWGLKIPPEVAAGGIAHLAGIPGRMERIDLGQGFTAIVDFAHTPNALRVAIETVRKMTNQRVIVIFGSAGLRDREKRRMMAEIAAELADISILTAEDPRSESLEDILIEMSNGATQGGAVEGSTFHRVPDRGDAIRMGVHLARPGDVVMVCGKGHEQSMCFNTTEYAWDDRVAMKAAVAELLNVPGPSMPYLPTQGGA